MEKCYLGRLRINPTNKYYDAFDYPKGSGEAYFCTDTIDGVEYYYTGKTKESAASSFPASLVKVICAKEVK